MWRAQDQRQNPAIQVLRALRLMTLAMASAVIETCLQSWSS
ncbi:hypothetical protein PK69_05345 [Xanthomonas phaseoli pv. phaseoli]|uniref:Transposase n=1 Tax=Xanthomonas campestris pv. phaseoli TaxID=317013 RepID=A0AB34QK75_XANCH|nr:hypothetical protein AC609_04580 [Xanthomonas phaseoli pv. phaseoli]AZU32507.1 hypothetical protein AC801_22975 [Xanthomonas sp. ISO98C4]AZU24777.1 hypothetical protein AC611_04585 [Xanthomonas phaseoli pv. phaseoli]AZU33544.1 hypothetical protein AC610_04580 [Xanthomonas phaseoli pv. phaseoli]KGT49595.1 hypothetical protein NZ02_18970 [Xanthomonas phaseoli pv. phaseoli]